ncbi:MULTISPECIES: GNAT family N-acetyltransferase [unclassified Exiguobacterium]|uniref:GNAT family N-acetyltransferase n=1 Tax=unclassified Exiguobacterium TaxID=2644629 RepID=UPI001BE5292E|nr:MULTISPECIES: GNAT family N-acetyltransferase [unclassified Exiguobacterium]
MNIQLTSCTAKDTEALYAFEIEKTAQLGYRIGQVHAGKGIAKEAVRLLLGQCREHDTDEVQAKTTDANIASQKILEHNGFEPIDKKEEAVLDGQRIQLMHYSWRR